MSATVQMQVEPIPAGKRSRAWGSTQLLREWLQLKYPGAPTFYELRLGPTHKTLEGVTVSPQLANMLAVSNWYADAIVIAPPELLLIEAKVNPDPGAVGQVLFYQRLLSSTPKLADFSHLAVIPLLLFAENDDQVSPFCRSFGCRVEIYTPPWIAQYLVQVQFKNRSPSQGNPAAGV